MLKSILVSVDLAPGSARILQRALSLPLARGAHVTLLHVLPTRLPGVHPAGPETDARRALAAMIAETRAARAPRLQLRPLVLSGAVAATVTAQARATRAELVVMGRLGARVLRDLFIGSNAERVLRQSRVPVLIVRGTGRAPYRRPLLAVDFDQAAAAALAVLPRLLSAPRPPTPLVHVFDAPLAWPAYPSVPTDEAREYRRRQRALLTGRLQRLLRTSADGAEGWAPTIRFGSPRLTIPGVVGARRADLLALGTHARSGAAQVFLGSVAGDVLRTVGCDVLLVPPRAGRRAG